MPDNGAMSVGDAVLHFFGDTTQLDKSFSKVEGQAAASSAKLAGAFVPVSAAADGAAAAVDGLGNELGKVPPVPPDVPESLEMTATAAREAKAEVGLLGEAIGVRLPRHVRGFITELPGVGQALSAAFTVTAIGFVLEAIVQVTEKLTELTSELMFNSEAWKESDKEAIKLNATLVELAKQYKELKEKAKEAGETELQIAKDREKVTKKSVEELTEAFKKNQDELKELTAAGVRHYTMMGGLREVYSQWHAGQIGFMTGIRELLTATEGQTMAAKKLAEAQDNVIVAGKRLQNAKLEETVAHKKVVEEVKKSDDAYKKLQQSTAALSLEHEKLLAEMHKLAAVSAVDVKVEVNEVAKSWQDLTKAMQVTGVSTADLSYKVQLQKGALDVLWDSMKKGMIGTREYQTADLALTKSEIELGQARGQDTAALERHEKALQKSLGLDKQKEVNLVRITKLEQAYQQVKQKTGSVEQAVWAVTEQAMGSAVEAYAMGQASIGQALAKMAQDELASLAQRATIKAIEQLALGFGTMFTNPAESGSHFTSAAIWGSIGAATAVAGRALGGAAGNNGAVGTYGNPVNVSGNATQTTATGSSPNPVQAVNVQSFGEGGIITKRTLAMIGDKAGNKSADSEEAVIPLGDPQSMRRLRESLGGSGDTHVQNHFHIQGVISGDTLHQVVDKINKSVEKNQLHLKSSSTFRVTKRSI